MVSNTDIVNLAMTGDGDRYVFGGEVSMDDPDPNGYDCSELVQWVCGHLGVDPRMPDGSWYQARHCRNNSTLISVDEAIRTEGALLFKFSSTPFEGGRPSSAHVAISQGNGKTIEARSTRYGVGQFSAYGRGWTHAARIPGVEYTGESTIIIPEGDEEDMKRGDKGKRVVKAQEQLMATGYGLPRYGADGDFGGETEAAVKEFQAAKSLDIDGVLQAVDMSILFRVALVTGIDATARTLARAAHDRLDDIHDVLEK